MKRLTAAAALAAVMAGGGVGLVAQETRSATLLTTEHWLDWERVSDAQISPDGSRIVYTRQHVNKLEDKWDSELWILNADGSQHRFLVKGGAPRWSPDGKRLLYQGEGEPKGPQLFVRWVDAEGPATQITHISEAPRNAKWSPDGKSIAFSMFVPSTDKWTISMPGEPKGAKWTPAPRVVSTIHYRQDQIGYLEDGFTHLFVVPADGGTARQLTTGKWSVGSGELRGGAAIDWTPDSKSIVFDGNRSPDADMQYETSQIYVAEVATGAIRELVSKAGEWGKPVVSPDGRTVVFTGYAPTGHSHTVSDMWVVPISGGSADVRKISGDFDRDPINMKWAPDGSGVYFDADDRGARNIQFAAIVGGVKPLTSGRQMLTFDSVSKDGIAAGIASDLDHPQDVVKYSVRQPGPVTRLTDVNADVLQGVQIAKSEEITYKSTGNATVMGWVVKPPSFDPSKKYPLILEIHGGPFGNYNVGFNYMFQNFAANGDVLQGIQLGKSEEITYTSSSNAKVMGWIVKPPSFDPSKKYPLILEIHGGPFGNYNVGFNYMFQNFAANGFVVLVTNPRGSTGYGSEFINGIDHNYPGPDYDDLMAGVDTVVGKGYIDQSRMYVSGCSGGGVLSSWVIGHTDRFAAAAVRCPVIDWLSMAGHTDIPLFTYSFFKKPFWEDPSDWLAHSSLMSVGKVTTPTLLMTGVLDRRTPMPQTEEYYAALKVKGVPVKLLQFNEEFHGTGSKPSNYIRTQLYMMSWFNQWTRAAGGKVSTTAAAQP